MQPAKGYRMLYLLHMCDISDLFSDPSLLRERLGTGKVKCTIHYSLSLVCTQYNTLFQKKTSKNCCASLFYISNIPLCIMLFYFEYM